MNFLSQHRRILVTGASGQLGQALREAASEIEDLEIEFKSRKELDITNMASIKTAIEAFEPDVIINTAAYTAVDDAESDSYGAYLINQKGAVYLAQVCKENRIALVHISTDYVFDGTATVPYETEHCTNPQGVYGASKLAGEEAIIEEDLDVYAIFRTSWLYSAFGHNFMKTMLRLGKDREELSVVNDQKGVPTSAHAFAKALLYVIPKLSEYTNGVYHYSNAGVTTWYGFAKEIFKQSGMDVRVLPVASTEYPTAAVRPKYSVLDTSKTKAVFNLDILPWEDELMTILKSIKD